MSAQHLSDEAVAAFADGVLRGHARERAARHTEGCAECARAVRVQREAVWALRAAPAPALPTSLADRLRLLPEHTPITVLPTVVDDDGTALMTANPMVAAALVPPRRPGQRQHPARANSALTSAVAGAGREHRVHPMLATAAVVALTGALTFGVVVGHDDTQMEPGAGQVVRQFTPMNDAPVEVIAPVSLFRSGGH